MAQGLILFSDSSRGVYIPKHFAEDVKRQYVTGIDLSELDYLLDNDYCDDNFWFHLQWIECCDGASFKRRGVRFLLDVP